MLLKHGLAGLTHKAAGGVDLTVYNGPSSEVPVFIADFDAGIYAKDSGSGLVETTFGGLITSGTLKTDYGDSIDRLRCETGDAPIGDITNLTLTSGTIECRYLTNLTAGGFERVFQFDLSTDTADSRITFWYDGTDLLKFQVRDTLLQHNFSTGYTLSTGTPVRLAGAWTAADYGSSVNGATAVSVQTGTVPSLDTLRLGHPPTAADELNGGIERFIIWDTRIVDANLETIST